MSIAGEKDSLQTCLNLIEGLEFSARDAKVFRGHCQRIHAMAKELRPLVETVQAELGDEFGKQKSTREVMDTLNHVLQAGVEMVHRCGTMGLLDKWMEKGDTKRSLEYIDARLFKDAMKARAYLKNEQLRAHDRKILKVPLPIPTSTPSMPQMGELSKSRANLPPSTPPPEDIATKPQSTNPFLYKEDLLSL